MGLHVPIAMQPRGRMYTHAFTHIHSTHPYVDNDPTPASISALGGSRSARGRRCECREPKLQRTEGVDGHGRTCTALSSTSEHTRTHTTGHGDPIQEE